MKTLLIFATFIAISYGFGNRADDQTYLNLMTGLKHGDNCSWENEQLRQNLSVNTMDKDFMVKFLHVIKFKSDVIAKGEKYCNAMQLLVCSPSTQKCVCGNPNLKALDLQEDPAHYTTETVNNEIKCRYATQYACSPEKLSTTTAELQPYREARCQSGSTCKAVNDRSSTCTNISVLLHVLINGVITDKRLQTDMYSGRVCTCQQDTSFAVVDENDDLMNSVYSRIRRKRSIQSEDEEIMAIMTVAGTPIFDQ